MYDLVKDHWASPDVQQIPTKEAVCPSAKDQLNFARENADQKPNATLILIRQCEVLYVAPNISPNILVVIGCQRQGSPRGFDKTVIMACLISLLILGPSVASELVQSALPRSAPSQARRRERMGGIEDSNNPDGYNWTGHTMNITTYFLVLHSRHAPTVMASATASNTDRR
ncbi:hypothetical protein VTH82DRAFT_2210 [Thermothelomyces myriococcoides]